MFKYTQTHRGFNLITFIDRYNHECNVQESSLASESAIWLGLESASPQIMASQAKEFGIETEATVGWIPYPIPDAVLLNTRMHLTQEQVQKLLPILQHFAETGNLPQRPKTMKEWIAQKRVENLQSQKNFRGK